MSDIGAIIQDIPLVFQYYVPGYLFILIFDFISAQKRQKGSNLHVESIAISYFIVLCTSFSTRLFNIYLDIVTIALINLILAIPLAYGFTNIIESVWFNKSLKFFKIKSSVKRSIWDDFIDSKLGTYATVYLKNENKIYCGRIVSYDYDKDNSSYFALAFYELYDYESKLLKCETNNQEVVILKLDDVDRVEFYYNENSVIPKSFEVPTK